MSFAQLPLASITYSHADNLTWSKLVANYGERLSEHGCKEFIDGFQRLEFDNARVEGVTELSNRLHAACGWRLQPVDRLLPNQLFFGLLNDRTFPVAVQMRRPDELAFSELPDLFHDALGHLPLLVHTAYSDFLVQYASVAGRYLDSPEALSHLARVYWYIIETGLVMEDGQEKLLGAAIATSAAECENAISPATQRIPFDFHTVFLSDYDSFRLQPRYFVIDSFSGLRRIAAELNAALLECLARTRDTGSSAVGKRMVRL